MGIETDLIAIANSNKTAACLIGFAIIVLSILIIAGAFSSKKKDNKEDKEEEMEDEDNEPEKQCSFQCCYDNDEKVWNCDLTDMNGYCDKSKCPFWR